MEGNALRLLSDVRNLLIQHQIAEAERYESNVIAFLNQCPNDIILNDAMVIWDRKGEFDFLWDTAHLDCIFSIGIEYVSWHLWVGENNHCKDDECYTHGVGGIEIEGSEENFAFSFMCPMDWHVITCGRK